MTDDVFARPDGIHPEVHLSALRLLVAWTELADADQTRLQFPPALIERGHLRRAAWRLWWRRLEAAMDVAQ